MNTFLSSIGKAIIAPFIAISSFFSHPTPPTPLPVIDKTFEQKIDRQIFDVTHAISNVEVRLGYLEDHFPVPLGASLPIPTSVALFETSLANKITSSATSMTLVSALDKTGTALASSTYAFIIDEGTATEEMVLADCTGTACTNMTRGISPLTGTTTVSALQFEHRRGASVKITDGPQLMILTRILNGIGTVPNLLSYLSGTACSGASSNSAICDKAYIDGVVGAGAADANTTTKGIVEIATAIENASSSATGSTGAVLVNPSSQATSTPVRGCDGTAVPGALCSVVARNDGTIHPNFIATSSLDVYNFGARINFNANASTTGISGGYGYFGESATTSISRTGVLTLGTTTSGIVRTNTSGITYAQNSETAKFLGQTTGITVTDTITPSTTTPINIPAGTLGTNGMIHAKFTPSFTDTAGSSNSDGRITIALGGTALCNLDVDDWSAGGAGMGDFYLFANGNASVYMFGTILTETNSNAIAGKQATCEATVATSTVTDNLQLTFTVGIDVNDAGDTESVSTGNIYTMFLGRQN